MVPSPALHPPVAGRVTRRNSGRKSPVSGRLSGSHNISYSTFSSSTRSLHTTTHHTPRTTDHTFRLSFDLDHTHTHTHKQKDLWLKPVDRLRSSQNVKFVSLLPFFFWKISLPELVYHQQMYDLKFMRQLYVFYYSFVDLYFCHLILMGRSMESYIDIYPPGFSYTLRTWLTKDGSKVFQFTWWSYVVVHVIRICFLFLYINNKWKYIHYRFGKQAKLELSYFFFKSRYSGLDWHPPVTEAATARPFTSNNMTSLVGPANHNFSTRRYKTFFLS